MKEKVIGNKYFMVFPDNGIVKGRVFKKPIGLDLDGCRKDAKNMIYHAIYSLKMDETPEYYKSIAKCDERDEFDEKKGIDLVGEKLDRKQHHKLAIKFRRLYLLFLECAAFCMARYEFHNEKVKKIDEDILKTYGTEGE